MPAPLNLPRGAPDGRAVRLSINVHPTVADALKEAAAAQGISLTEAVRKAIALLDLHQKATQSGERLMLVQGHGECATYREILLF